MQNAKCKVKNAKCSAGFLLAAVVVLAASLCAADDAPIREAPRHLAAPSSIALLNVRHLLDHHPALQRRTEEIAAGVALAEAIIAQRKREIGRLSERLAGLQAGSAEHTELDLKLIRERAELKGQIRGARAKLATEQARADAAAYQEIVRAVERYLAETGYRVVLRKDSGGVDPGDAVIPGAARPVTLSAANPVMLSAAKNLDPRPAEIHPPAQKDNRGNSPLVFAQGGVDITQDILRRLHEGRQRAAGRMQQASHR